MFTGAARELTLASTVTPSNPEDNRDALFDALGAVNAERLIRAEG